MTRKQFDKIHEMLWVITLLWVVIGAVITGITWAAGPFFISWLGGAAWAIAAIQFGNYGVRKGLV